MQDDDEDPFIGKFEALIIGATIGLTIVVLLDRFFFFPKILGG